MPASHSKSASIDRVDRAMVAMLTASWLTLAARRLDYVADDAVILFRHVHNHAEGRGLVWDAWHPVQAHSSPAWAWLLRGAHALGFGIAPTARVLGVAAAIASVVIVHALARRRLERGPAFALAALFGAFPPLVLWASAGLEGTLALLASVSFVAALGAPEDGPPRARARAAVLLALAFVGSFVRPDLPMQFIAASVGFAALRRRERALCAATVFAAIAGVLAGLVVSKVLYGDWLPMPARVKSRVEALNVLRYARYVLYQGPELAAGLVCVATLAVRRWRRVRDDDAALAAALLLGAHLGEFALLGGDELARGRMLITPAACATILAATLLAPEPGASKPRASRLRSVGIPLVVLATLFGIAARALQHETDRECGVWREAAGRWLRANTDPSFSIAVLPAGYLPYYSERPTVDLLGLGHPRIATLRGVARGSRAWAQRAMAIADDEGVCAAVLASCVASVPGPGPCGADPAILGMADVITARGGYRLARANLGPVGELFMAVSERCSQRIHGPVRWEPLPW